MTAEEFYSDFQVNENAECIGEWEEYESAILGVTHDGDHIVYSYSRMVEALSKVYSGCEDIEDAETAAVDWIDYNVLRTLPYRPEATRPIVIFENVN